VIPPEIVPYLNLVANIATIAIIVALAVWLRKQHIQVVELKGQLLGMVLALRLSINGNHKKEGEHGPRDTDTG